MELVSSILTFLAPPFAGLRIPHDYRGAPLLERVRGKAVVAVNAGEQQLQCALLSFSKDECTYNALPTLPAVRPFHITAEQVKGLRTRTKAKYLAMSLGSGPEQGEIELVTNIRRYPTDAGFHAALHHSPGDYVKKPKTGFVYRGIQHPIMPAAIITMINPARDDELAREAKAGGLMLVRLQMNLLQLANIALTDSRLDGGGYVLICDQGHLLLVTLGAKASWEGVRYRKIKQTAEDLGVILQTVLKPTIRDTKLPIIVLDTASSGVDTSTLVKPFNAVPFNIAGVDTAYLPNIGLAAA